MNDEKSLLKQFVKNHSLHPLDRRNLIEYVYLCKLKSLPIDYKAFEALHPENSQAATDAVVD